MEDRYSLRMNKIKMAFKILLITTLFQVFSLQVVSGTDPHYLGCYNDVSGAPDLNNHSQELATTNSPQACQSLCRDLGFPYAGLQNGKQCNCGQSFGKYGQFLDAGCNHTCPGDTAEFCGGEDKHSVYKTELWPLYSWEEVVTKDTPAGKIKHFGVGTIAGGTQVWAIADAAGHLYGGSYYKKGDSWVQFAGDVDQVSVGPAGVFAATGAGEMFIRTGVTTALPEGEEWIYTSGGLHTFDSGLYALYGTSPWNEVFYYTSGSGWVKIGDEAQNGLSTSTGKYALWLITEDNIIYRTGIDSTERVGTRGSFSNDGKVLISASDEGMVISLDSNGTLYYREGVNKANPIGTKWVPIHGRKFKHVVADHFAIWGLDDNGKIWKGELEFDSSYVGCYKDHGMNLDLKGLVLSSNDMTVEKCRRICASNNFVYAAVQFWSNCRCDNKYGLHGGKYPEKDCVTECNGNFYEPCGGWSRNSIYVSGRVEIVDASPNQRLSKNEVVEMVCRTKSILSPVYVAWTKDGVVLQNRTKNTNLVVSSTQSGTFIYQCSVHHGSLSDSKNITVIVEDSIIPCGNHLSINDPTRSSKNCGGLETIKRLNSSKWYQFYGNGGTQIPTSCVKENSCGAKATGWLNGGHPEREDGVVTRKLCFNYKGDCCYFSVTVNVRHCYGYYIYKFPEIPDYFPGRICTEKEPRGTGPSSKVSSKVFMSSPKTKNLALDGHQIATYDASNSGACNIYCLLTPQCKSFNYNQASKECELNDEMAKKGSSYMVTRKGFSYYHPVGTGIRVTPQN